MNLALGSDHAAWREKERVAAWLREHHHEVRDFGTDSDESVDYPDFGRRVGQAVAAGEVDFGILLCGSGIGISIAANKVNGVRAALCHSDLTARLSRQHNDANVLCLGARVIGIEQILSAVESFLATAFEGGRHARRRDKIHAIESGD